MRILHILDRKHSKCPFSHFYSSSMLTFYLILLTTCYFSGKGQDEVRSSSLEEPSPIPWQTKICYFCKIREYDIRRSWSSKSAILQSARYVIEICCCDFTFIELYRSPDGLRSVDRTIFSDNWENNGIFKHHELNYELSIGTSMNVLQVPPTVLLTPSIHVSHSLILLAV